MQHLLGRGTLVRYWPCSASWVLWYLFLKGAVSLLKWVLFGRDEGKTRNSNDRVWIPWLCFSASGHFRTYRNGWLRAFLHFLRFRSSWRIVCSISDYLCRGNRIVILQEDTLISSINGVKASSIRNVVACRRQKCNFQIQIMIGHKICGDGHEQFRAVEVLPLLFSPFRVPLICAKKNPRSWKWYKLTQRTPKAIS